MRRELQQLQADVDMLRRQIAGMQARQRTLRGTVRTIRQVGHGFAVGDVVRISGANTYAKAKADTAANAQAVGVVGVVVSANTFMLYGPGTVIPGLSSITAGTRYYLSAATAGAVTSTAPTIAVPIFDAISTKEGMVIIGQPTVILEVLGSGSLNAVSNSTWSSGRKLVSFLVIGGGGGGGGAGSAASATNYWANGGGGSSGKVRLVQFVMEDGYTLEVTNGAGGAGGSATNNGSSGGQSNLTIKSAAGATLLSVDAGGGGGGGGAQSGSVCMPGLGGTAAGGYAGQPGRFTRFSSGFAINDSRSPGGSVPFITATTGSGGSGGYDSGTTGSAGSAGGSYYF